MQEKGLPWIGLRSGRPIPEKWDTVHEAERKLALQKHRRRTGDATQRTRQTMAQRAALKKVLRDAHDRAVHAHKRKTFEFHSRFLSDAAPPAPMKSPRKSAFAVDAVVFVLPIEPTVESHKEFLDQAYRVAEDAAAKIDPEYPLFLMARDVAREFMVWDMLQHGEFSRMPREDKFSALFHKQGPDTIRQYLQTHTYVPVQPFPMRIDGHGTGMEQLLMQSLCAFMLATAPGSLASPPEAKLFNLLPDLVRGTLLFKFHGWGSLDALLLTTHDWILRLPYGPPFTAAMLTLARDLCRRQGTLDTEEERSPEFSLRVALCYPDLAMQWWPGRIHESPYFEMLTHELVRLYAVNPDHCTATFAEVVKTAPAKSLRVLPLLFILPPAFMAYQIGRAHV